jgi:hypothetical protein
LRTDWTDVDDLANLVWDAGTTDLRINELGTNTNLWLPVNSREVANLIRGIFIAFLVDYPSIDRPTALAIFHTRCAKQFQSHAESSVPAVIAERGSTAHTKMRTHRLTEWFSVVTACKHFITWR